MQINTVTQQATKPKREKPKPTCHHRKKPGHYRKQCSHLKRERDQNDTNKNSNINSGQTKSKTHNKKPPVRAMPIVQTTGITEKQELSAHPMRPVAKRTTLWRIAILEPMQQIDCLLGTVDRQNEVKINNPTHR